MDENTRDQVKRLTALTNQMVALSRLDENPEPKEKAKFDLSDVAYEVIDHFSSLSEVRGKKISADIEDGIKYVGDENSIRQLISILVDNAMKYAVESADISISLKRDGRKVKFVLKTSQMAWKRALRIYCLRDSIDLTAQEIRRPEVRE